MAKEGGLRLAVAEATAEAGHLGGRTFCWVCQGLTPGLRRLSARSEPLLPQPLQQPPSAWSMACVWTMLLQLLLMEVVFGRHRRGQYGRHLRYRAARL